MNNSTDGDARSKTVSDIRESIKARLSNGEKQDLWSVLLDNASQGKRLPEKSLIVLGKVFQAM